MALPWWVLCLMGKAQSLRWEKSQSDGGISPALEKLPVYQGDAALALAMAKKVPEYSRFMMHHGHLQASQLGYQRCLAHATLPRHKDLVAGSVNGHRRGQHWSLEQPKYTPAVLAQDAGQVLLALSALVPVWDNH